MKRVLSIILAVLLLTSAVFAVGCAKKTLKLGLGVYSYYEKVESADGDTPGLGQVVSTAAAVLVDGDGKVVKCEIDTADNTINFTSEGKYVTEPEFKTKYEKGNDYGMKNNPAVTKEWFEQADAFETLVIGKTLDEIKALVASNGKVAEGVENAGCTISVKDFVLAVEKAINNAAESEATAEDTLKLGIVTEQSGADATEEKAGSNELLTTICAAATDKDGKVVAITTDSVNVKFAFDLDGVCTTDKNASISTKKEAGADYNMSKFGTDLNGDGTVKEWFEQAAAFDAACAGKTASEISGLANTTGYGIDSLQTAGCTINVSGMVKAAVKAATV